MEKKKSVWPKIFIVLGILLVLIIGAGTYVYFEYFYLPVGKWTPIELTKENLPSYLERFGAIDDLPADSEIQLYVDNIPYTISKGKVDIGETTSADIVINLPGKYLEVMGEKGWCAGLSEAKNNGDIEIKVNGEGEDLLWKYKALVKYRDCIG